MNNNLALKSRFVVMNFLEFAVWGSYLTSMGSYLVNVGLARDIAWFYAVQGVVSIFMPGLMGIIADRWIPAQRLLGLCHLIAAIFMGATGFYGLGSAGNVQMPILFGLYSISVAFYMPTLALSNSVAFTGLTNAGMDTIPACPTSKGEEKKSIVEALGLNAFYLFKQKRMAIFFIFSMLLGVSLQITNGFANPYIQTYGQLPEFTDTFGAQHANILISISQISETCCILLIPFFMKRFGIKTVMLIAMAAWVFRFGLFGIGDPGSGVWMFILSMIVYGVAFDFFNISGALFVDRNTSSSIRSSAQGLFMIMTNGLGATIGTLGAQQIINHFVYDLPSTASGLEKIAGWKMSWLIFAGYSLCVLLLFWLAFSEHKQMKVTKN